MKTPIRQSINLALTLTVAAGAGVLLPLAGAAEAGHIEGHVLRGKEARPLVGAVVSVKETGAIVRAGPDGHFAFDGLPAGKVTLQVSAEGMDAIERSVDPADGKPVEITVEVAATALETIVVQAQNVPGEIARAAQQEALNLVNITTAEEIRKLPDVNAAEALQRVPGISLESDTGEGRFINIRGLTSDLNATTFGGLRLPPSNPASPFNGGRAVAYDAIPTGLIGALTVTKTNTPEQDAEALGGTIEITPKTAPRNGKPFIEGHVGTGRETLRDTNIQDYSVTAGTRFGSDFGMGDGKGMTAYKDLPFSLVLTASYYEDKRGIDDIEAGYVDGQPSVPDKAFAGFEQRYYQYNRKRHGFGFDFGYEPDANSKYYLRAFDAGYTETVNRQRLSWNFDGNAAVNPANPQGLIDTVSSWDKTLRDEKERINNKVVAIGGENRSDAYTIDYRLGYTRGSFDKLYDFNSKFTYDASASPATVAYDNTSDPNFPSFHVVSGPSPYNWGNYVLGKFTNSTETLSDHETSAVANITVPTHLTSYDSESIKAGVSIRARKRDDVQPNYTYSGFPAIALTSASAGDVSFYGGRYNNGPQIDYNVIRSLFSNGQAYGALDPIATAQSATSGKENVYAAYGQYEFGVGKLSVLSGLRVEQTRASYSANIINADTNTFVGSITKSTSYTNLFPSIQGRLALREDLIARAVISSTIARPGFSQVNPALILSPSTDSASFGDPNLKPTTSSNIDLSIEKYLPNAGILSVGLFDKEITDFIAQIVTTQTISSSGVFSQFPGTDVHVTTYANIPNARAWGLEAAYEQRYRQLPGFWGGLGTNVNWTFVDSSGQFRSGVSQTLPSSSRNTANFEIFYERYGVDVRVGAYYVSRNLFGFGGSIATDVYSEARTTVDLGASYAFTKNLSVYGNMKNITNTPLKFTEGEPGRPIQREFYGPTYQAGLQFNF